MKAKILIIATTVLLTLACEKPSGNITEKEYYPNTTASWWKYARYDSLTHSADTFTVSILGDTLIHNGVYKIWNYNYPYIAEKSYVMQQHDSVIIFNTQIDRIDQLYIVPFETGNGWINPDYPFDTSYVSKVDDIEVNGMLYPDAILIERRAACCNDYLTEKIWIKPEVGLISLERKHIILGPYKNEVWQLLEYEVK